MKTIDVLKFWQYAVGEIVAVADMPSLLSNGFLADFRADDIIAMGNFKPDRTKESWSIDLTQCSEELNIQFDGRTADYFVPEEYGLYAYQLKTQSGKIAFLQKPYVEYFLRRYPGCTFWYEASNKAVAVMLGNEIIGALMPIDPKVEYFPIKAK